MNQTLKAPTAQPAESEDSLSALTGDGDARLRTLIRAELDRQHALPVARRTLEMLVEAGAEPVEGTPGYRIVDRSGETRLRPVTPEQAKKGVLPDTPLTLSEFVDELRARYPELFGEAPSEPEPEVQPDPHDSLQDKVAQVRAVGARFVQTQSSYAKSFAAHSAERGRALAATAGETVEGWRSQLDERLQASRTAAPDDVTTQAAPITPSAAPAPTATPQARRDWRGLVSRTVGQFKPGERTRRERGSVGSETVSDPSRADPMPSGTGPSRRPYAWALGALAAVGLLAIALTSGRNGTATDPNAVRQQADVTPSASPQSSASSETAPKPAAPPTASTSPAQPPAPAAQSPAPASPPADLEEQPDDAPVRSGNEISGVAEVIDTATLRLSGKIVRLFGVEWVRGGQAEDLSKYLARRTVICQPAPGSSAYLCTVEGRDLSEVVLFNGGGRASPEAGPSLVAAEDHARSERLGVWKR